MLSLLITHRRVLECLVIACSSAFWATSPAIAAPDPSPDPTASVVFLRTNCSVGGPSTATGVTVDSTTIPSVPSSHIHGGSISNSVVPLKNCFESASSLWNTTNGWIWSTRNPTAASPLLVDVGPGTFGPFTCDGTTKGYVSVRGAGREISILKGAGSEANGATIQNCVNLSFMDIGLHGDTQGVLWTGRGNASWTNVDMVTTGLGGPVYGWNDVCDDENPGQSVHHIHGSRVRNSGTPNTSWVFAWGSQCSQTWFFGGEILATLSGSSSLFSSSGGVQLENGAMLQVYGATIRALAVSGGSSQASFNVVGANVTGGSEFHSHGGTISARVLPAAIQTMNAVGINIVNSTSSIHTPGTAFVVEGGTSATSKRLAGSTSAKIRDVFVWESGKLPPGSTSEANRVTSVRNGNDVWIETDCSSTGNCNNGGNETHLMIYNAAQCPALNPWFDTRTGACRF